MTAALRPPILCPQDAWDLLTRPPHPFGAAGLGDEPAGCLPATRHSRMGFPSSRRCRDPFGLPSPHGRLRSCSRMGWTRQTHWPGHSGLCARGGNQPGPVCQWRSECTWRLGCMEVGRLWGAREGAGSASEKGGALHCGPRQSWGLARGPESWGGMRGPAATCPRGDASGVQHLPLISYYGVQQEK